MTKLAEIYHINKASYIRIISGEHKGKAILKVERSYNYAPLKFKFSDAKTPMAFYEDSSVDKMKLDLVFKNLREQGLEWELVKF